MRKKPWLISAPPFVVFIAVFASHAASQSAQRGDTGKASQQAGRLLSFTDTGGDLPARYNGTDADLLYRSVEARLQHPSKSEFESISQYTARMSDFSNESMLGGAKPSDSFAFVLGEARGPCGACSDNILPGRMYGRLETAYDAESQELTITVPSEPLPEDIMGPGSQRTGTTSSWVSIWRYFTKPLGSTVGTNAFGVRRTISHSVVTETDIVVNGSDWLRDYCSYGRSSEVSCRVQMVSFKARALSRNIRVLVVGSLAPPFIFTSSDKSGPTIDEPAEIEWHYRLIRVDLDKLIIFDGVTGEVLRSFSRAQHDTEYPIEVDIRSRSGTDRVPLLSTSIDDGNSESLGSIHLPIRLWAKKHVDLEVEKIDLADLEFSQNGVPKTPDGCTVYLCVARFSLTPLIPTTNPTPPVAAAKPTAPVRLSSGMAAAMAISQPQPTYPPIAKAAHVQGVVILHTNISKEGAIENLQVISGPPMLTSSALDAVKHWRYKPYILDGQAVEVETTINVTFSFGTLLP